MASPSKTIQTQPVAWQDVASTGQVISSVIDVSTKFLVAFVILLGRATGSAFTSGWPKVRIEVSGLASGNNFWSELDTFQMQVGASIGSTTLNGALTAGATTATLTSVTNFNIGDLVFLGDSSAANYELIKIKSIAGSVITFEEACTNNHANGAVVTSQAERYCPTYDVGAYKSVRVVVDNANSGQGIKAAVACITEDSVA